MKIEGQENDFAVLVHVFLMELVAVGLVDVCVCVVCSLKVRRTPLRRSTRDYYS